jgi:hypothetical protein
LYMLIHQIISAEIYSVKLFLKNVPYFDSSFWKTRFIFSQDRLVFLLYLGTEWLHMKFISRSKRIPISLNISLPFYPPPGSVTVTHQFCPSCDCATAKIKQTKIAKFSRTSTNKPGERIYIDISSVKTESYGGSKFWLLSVDNYLDMCWRRFLSAKCAIRSEMILFLKTFQLAKTPVSYIRCDNAGENTALQRDCLYHNLHVIFELT